MLENFAVYAHTAFIHAAKDYIAIHSNYIITPWPRVQGDTKNSAGR